MSEQMMEDPRGKYPRPPFAADPRPCSSVGIAIDAVSKTEEMQEHFPELPPIVRKVGTRRCYQCNGRFGLVRYELINKTFCSKRCFDKHTRQTIARQLLGLGAGEWLIFILGITLVGLWVTSAIEQSAEFREAAYAVFGAFQLDDDHHASNMGVPPKRTGGHS
jgi:hypothetical protein